MLRKTNKRFVSSIDTRLAEFNATHPLSNSQKAEIAKYERIYYLRDHKVPMIKSEIEIWSEF